MDSDLDLYTAHHISKKINLALRFQLSSYIQGALLNAWEPLNAFLAAYDELEFNCRGCGAARRVQIKHSLSFLRCPIPPSGSWTEYCAPQSRDPPSKESSLNEVCYFSRRATRLTCYDLGVYFPTISAKPSITCLEQVFEFAPQASSRTVATWKKYWMILKLSGKRVRFY